MPPYSIIPTIKILLPAASVHTSKTTVSSFSTSPAVPQILMLRLNCEVFRIRGALVDPHGSFLPSCHQRHLGPGFPFFFLPWTKTVFSESPFKTEMEDVLQYDSKYPHQIIPSCSKDNVQTTVTEFSKSPNNDESYT
ncbi:hypothetical protein ARMGADRAFT_1032084 [Armillaria gallica]|uniref:Uncharacterized protein n=1 Tax=Armillaria gallica TaxID=47427 RepID=A0A2H3D6Z3_ARMGA|nr:hypothetical protein ARMGADRAFT_1032084 [Armillaria gallica]